MGSNPPCLWFNWFGDGTVGEVVEYDKCIKAMEKIPEALENKLERDRLAAVHAVLFELFIAFFVYFLLTLFPPLQTSASRNFSTINQGAMQPRHFRIHGDVIPTCWFLFLIVFYCFLLSQYLEIQIRLLTSPMIQ